MTPTRRRDGWSVRRATAVPAGRAAICTARRGGARGDPALAVIVLVEAGHDPQQGRLAGAVDAEHTDLGVGVERQMDVIEHLPGRVALGQTLHEVNELASHRDPLKPEDLWKFAAADVAARPGKGNHGNPFSIRSPRMNTG